ncbi:unnamed protein product [Cyprideis torosa]|uniref:Transmembrane 9 superfamily member n=1 Tax=Cyprideis torosa TaxID=163714 RepID=A0A7R8WLQ7_9CRUS|nr:unnamed protein product [Cyprideis torosa]CAG0902723.1 unnamed protein product [Cyprideis torosa]
MWGRRGDEKELCDEDAFDFCPANVNAAPVENLGQIVFGERIQLSLYDIEFLKNEECKLLCQPKKYQAAHDANLARLINGILLNYYHHWIVDNMPVRWCFSVGSLRQCKNGFPMGCYVNSNHEINVPCAVSSQMLMKLADTFIYYNHVDLNISYHSGEGEEWGERFSDPTRGGRIVSVRVSPRSISHESADNLNCGGDRPLLTFGPKTLPPGSQIIYTYSVNFVVRAGVALE